MTGHTVETSWRLKGRIAGVLYFCSVLTAIFGESVNGKLGYIAGNIAIAGMVAVTLLIYVLFKPANGILSSLAAALSLVGLVFETLRWNPGGVDLAVALHGAYCITIGYLIFRSSFLPRILGLLMALAGWGWLSFLSPPLANHITPYNLAAGFIGEGAVFLWLVVGVNVRRWNERANAAEVWR
jgi:hypothetical protein